MSQKNQNHRFLQKKSQETETDLALYVGAYRDSKESVKVRMSLQNSTSCGNPITPTIYIFILYV